MGTKQNRSKVVLRATLTADGKLDGEISGTGQQELRTLLKKGQVDELHLTVRPKIDGRRGEQTLSGQNHDFFPRSIPLRLLRMEVHGDECLLHYRVVRRRQKRPVAL